MFNSMSTLPNVPYIIVKLLAEKNEIIWKMMKYNSYDAISKPNLTMSEKLDMLWKEGPQTNYNLFLTNLIEDSIIQSKSIMKIYQYYIHASSLYSSTVVYAFDFLYGGQMSLVEYKGVPVSRGDLFVNQILETLNGAEVGGVGKFVFLDDKSRYSLARSVIGNSKTFTGECIYLAVDIGNIGKDECCEC